MLSHSFFNASLLDKVKAFEKTVLFLKVPTGMTRVEVDLVKELYFRKILGVLSDDMEDRKLPVHVAKESYELHRSKIILDYMAAYVNYSIKSLYGITVLEFLNLSKNEIEFMISCAMQAKASKSNELSSIMEELEKSGE